MTQTEKIRALNIAFLRNPHINGRLMLSRYVADRGPQFVEKCLEALAGYDGWNADNDPYHEVDFCTIDIDAENIFASSIAATSSIRLRQRRSRRPGEDTSHRDACSPRNAELAVQ